MAKKYFTLRSAQNQIPKIKKSLVKLQNLKKAIDAILSVKMDPQEVEHDEFIETNTKLSKEYHKLSYDFHAELEKLQKVGCILKDLELGLVDFYFRLEERDVFLCWNLGEARIMAWHETDSGYASRQSIIDL